MVLLVATVAVALIVLPLAAVAWSRSRHANRPAPPSWLDVLYAVGRRHHLSGAQLEDVKRAVNGGRAAPPELRPATAAAAEAKVRWLQSILNTGPGSRRTAVAAFVAITAALVAIALVLSRSDGETVVLVLAVALTQLVMRAVWAFQLRRARRAEHLNGDMGLVPVKPPPSQ